MTISNPTISNRSQEAAEQPSALAEISQETLALTRRLFLQLQRRPSTLVA